MSINPLPADCLTEPRPTEAGAAFAAPTVPLLARQPPSLFSAVCLDWAERLLVLGFYGWLVARLIAAYCASGQVSHLLLLMSEGLVVFFILIRRRSTDISRHPGHWLLALTATC